MLSDLLHHYETGPRLVRQAVHHMTPEQLDARPVAGKWSTRQVICHLADFEPIYADRMKRVIAEEGPMLMGGDPDVFASKLAYGDREIETELTIIESTRKQMIGILKTLQEADFERVGHHNHDGELSLKTLLERITGHIPHHLETIEEKKRALGL
ncbi:MAG: DinB family protein [Rubinisphaera brasiliensis]|uniref:DinB-like domain-containing protein n=1 Tax=Rubinisphaera brasiliensis (strain ATCC 49424 / DSM 5305 / JCM 21570 / IAM 15109 / NBRC 103401 / IFAM 1448) TaxID=756272 RepID=F0SP45_RUBBR|nr:DinB family protein [Rubinisphaera brasiliensis]ADY61148.1 hypothetical protein Plabr_3551 [Rubinisphaera brasiliensis DSM 5305]